MSETIGFEFKPFEFVSIFGFRASNLKRVSNNIPRKNVSHLNGTI